MNDFLWDSPIYQEIIGTAEAKGRAEGKAEEMARGKAEGIEQALLQALSQTQQSLLKLIAIRFPTLQALAQKCVRVSTDNEALLQVLVQICVAQTEQDARQTLQTFLIA